VTFYRRRLPHFYNHDQPVFLTWCLHGSLPPNRTFPRAVLTSGEAFAALDRLLDEARTGPFYLKQPVIAALVVAAIHHACDALKHYTLHAYAVMPNHVHMLVSPQVPLPTLTKTLKTFTARRANAWLGRGVPATLSRKKKAMIAWSAISVSSTASTPTSKIIPCARA